LHERVPFSLKTFFKAIEVWKTLGYNTRRKGNTYEPISQNPSSLLPTISILMGIIFSTQVATTMALDEKSNWKKIATAMPLSLREIVASKYILSIILSVLSGIVYLLVAKYHCQPRKYQFN